MEASVFLTKRDFNAYSRDIDAKFLHDLGARKIDIFDDVNCDLNKIASEKCGSPRPIRVMNGRLVAHNIASSWSCAIASF
jgi:hypothetical protein